MRVVLKTIMCVLVIGSMLISALGTGINSVEQISSEEINENTTNPNADTALTNEKDIPSEYQNEESIAPEDYDSIFPSDPNLLSDPGQSILSENNSHVEDAHQISQVWSEGYYGNGTTMAVVDTGVDFGHMDLQGTQAISGDISVVGETVIIASGGETSAFLKNGNVIASTCTLQKNSSSFTDFTLDLPTGNITFTTPLAVGEIINATYEYRPSFYGWPVAFDPKSMRTFLKNNDTAGTWYANTSRTGLGPFPLIHDIELDGTNDFGEISEKFGADTRNDAPSILDGGNKYDYDLTDTYMTRDENFWYMGIPTYPQRAPESYGTYDYPSIGVYIDVDNGTSGTATVDPYGNFVNTLTSHSDIVTDVKYSPDGTMVASASMDKVIKIWDTSTGMVLDTLLGHTGIPRSLDWTPDSTKLISVENTDMYLWDVTSGELDGKMRYLDDFTDEVGKDFYDAFTKTGTLSISPNGTWAAISTKQYVYVVDIASMTLFGKIYVIGGNNVNTVAFHPTEPWIAVGLGVKFGSYFPVRVYNLNATVLDGTTTAIINRTLGGLAAPSGHDTQLTNLAWHPTDRDILASVSYGGTDTNPGEIIIWDVPTETITTEIVASNYSSNVYGVAWSPSGANLVTAESGTYIEGYDSPPVITVRDNFGIPVKTINGTLPFNSVDFSLDGLNFVTGSTDRRASVWNNPTGDLSEILTANKPDYALYADTDMIWDQKNEEYTPYLYNASFNKWNEGTGSWDEQPLNNITWDVTNEVLIASYADTITSVPFTSAMNFAFSEILSYQVFKNGVLWPMDGNYSEGDILDKRILTISETAVISAGDVITATYEYVTAGDQANFQWGIMLFNEFAIPRVAFGDPNAISFEVFTVGRDNATHAQDTSPADKGVFDNDFNAKEDGGFGIFSGVNMDTVHHITNETAVDGAIGGQTYAQLANSNITVTPFFSTITEKWYNETIEIYINYDYSDIGGNEPLAGSDYTLDSATGNITLNTALTAGDIVSVYYSYIIESMTKTNPTSLGNFAYVEIGSYTVDGITSESNNFHFGFHPSEIIQKAYGTLGMLVVDSTTNSVYDKVILDMNNDHVFDSSDVVIDKDNPIAWLDNFNRTAADANDVANKSLPDDYPDVSAGMLYFISDGNTPIPYSERYAEIAELNDEDNYKTPTNGDLLAFMGEFDFDSITKAKSGHGTKMASRLVSQGNMDTYQVMGLSPGAKIIPIGGKKTKSDVIASWYFAVEGYDGLIGTGDEAQIVLNGFNYPSIYEAGWDDYSRTADYISMVYAEEKALFVMSAGDDGYGYGTVSAPGAAPGVLTVGSATDNLWTTTQGGGSDGSNHYFGDVPPRASRGPTAMGIPKPDVVAINTGFVNRPLASVPDGTDAYTFPQPMTGSDHSAAVASSIASLVYQAYFQTHSEYPTASIAKRLLMSGADDVGYDILTQGAGFLNANRSVAMANDTYGISSSHDFWVPGNYEGLSYEGFASLVEAGDSIGETVTLSNYGAEETVNITDTLFAKIGENNFINYTIDNYYYPVTDKNATDWYSPGEIVMWLNETGLNKIDSTAADGPTGLDLSTTFQNTPVNVVPATPGLWERASMIRVTAYTDFAIFSELDESKLNHSYRLSLLDWEKGPDSNLNGNPALPVYFPCPSSEGLNYPEDLNIVSETYNMMESNGVISNVLETRITNPASRIHDGLVIYLNPTSDTMKEENIEWNFKIEYFEKMDWDWLSLNSDALTIGANSAAALGATVSVPPGTGMGSYEGAISLHHNEQNITNESIHNVATYTSIDDPVNAQTDQITNLLHGNVTGVSDMWKMRPDGVFANDTVVYAPDGSEITPWGFNLPHVNITNYTYLVFLMLGDSVYNASDLADFTVDTTTGYVEFTSSDWDDPLGNYGITEFYAWYEYAEPPLLMTGANYTLYPTNGTIILNAADALQPGEYLVANYSWYNPIINPFYRLDHTNIVDGTSVVLYDGATLNEGVDYDLDHIAGVITFDSFLVPTFIGNVTVNYTYYANSITIPVLVNVWSPVNKFDYGGENSLGYEGLYNNSIVLGGYDMTLKTGLESKARPYTGDRRFFFFNIPNQGLYANADNLNMRMLMELDWLNKPSDIDMLLLSRKNTVDEAARNLPSRYGSYTLENKGGSEEVSEPIFNTATNISEEAIAPSVTPGLNVLMLHGTILDGASTHETIQGKSCEVTLSSSVDVITPDAAGTAPISLNSNAEWAAVNASAVGPAISEVYENMEIPQDYEDWWNYPNWGEWLMYGSDTYWLNLSSCLILEVHLEGYDDCPDLDLGVFQDINGDGELTTDEVLDGLCIKAGGINWDYDADADADETVKWVAPPDGPYIIKVLGFTTTSTISSGEKGGHYDLTISQTLDTGKGYELVGTNEKDIIIVEPGNEIVPDDTTLPAFQVLDFEIEWNFPGNVEDGDYGGAVMVGTANAPGLIVIPVTISLDREAPEIIEVGPSDGLIISNTRPTIYASFNDLTRAELESATIHLDGIDISTIAKSTIDFDGDAKGAGYPLGTISYKPEAPLSDGTHRVDVMAYDWAGNHALITWTFTVDTIEPYMDISYPQREIIYVNEPSLTILGKTEPATELKISGAPSYITLNPNGEFSATVDVTEGDNPISIISVDATGNKKETPIMVILDTEAPEFDRIVALDGATTSKRITGIYGELSEPGTLVVDGIEVIVNGDGTFRYESVELIEGPNMLTMEFTDVAGNAVNNYMNITLDTAAPNLRLDGVESVVNDPQLNISGTTESDVASLTVNGKLAPVGGSGEFQNSITLSPGSNTIVIESKDRAGNAVQEILTVTLAEDSASGTNWAAISVMILLAVVGLILGLMFGRMFLADEPVEEEPPEDEIPEDVDAEEAEDADSPESEDIGDELPEEDVPEDIEGEDIDSEDMEETAEIPEGAEPIPVEEGMPEDIPEDELPSDELLKEELPDEDIPEDEVPEDDIPEEDMDSLEPEEVDEEPADISDEITSEEEALEEELPEEELPEDEIPEEVDGEDIDSEDVESPEAEEDPRIAKLKEAFESGKISEELYEKNLARFKGD